MLGISDPGIFCAYLLVFICVIFAVIYGIINWNKGDETNDEELETNRNWEQKEEQIKEQEA